MTYTLLSYYYQIRLNDPILNDLHPIIILYHSILLSYNNIISLESYQMTLWNDLHPNIHTIRLRI